MGYGFKCPQCGGFKWGTLDCGKPKQEWIGVCNGDRDYPGCGFRWHRATEDEKIIGIPFGVHDKTPNDRNERPEASAATGEGDEEYSVGSSYCAAAIRALT